jgi:death on curing protein
MTEPIWIEKPEVLVAHAMQLSEHGGSEGIRDEGLLESALSKPKNVFAYDENPNLCRLAASYAFVIARNHPFLDGNKRTALVVSLGFLRVNGLSVVSTPEDTYFTFLHLADGTLSEDELTQWFKQHAVLL